MPGTWIEIQQVLQVSPGFEPSELEEEGTFSFYDIRMRVWAWVNPLGSLQIEYNRVIMECHGCSPIFPVN